MEHFAVIEDIPASITLIRIHNDDVDPQHPLPRTIDEVRPNNRLFPIPEWIDRVSSTNIVLMHCIKIALERMRERHRKEIVTVFLACGTLAHK